MYYYCTILGRIFITIYSKKARNIADSVLLKSCAYTCVQCAFGQNHYKNLVFSPFPQTYHLHTYYCGQFFNIPAYALYARNRQIAHTMRIHSVLQISCAYLCEQCAFGQNHYKNLVFSQFLQTFHLPTYYFGQFFNIPAYALYAQNRKIAHTMRIHSVL